MHTFAEPIHLKNKKIQILTKKPLLVGERPPSSKGPIKLTAEQILPVGAGAVPKISRSKIVSAKKIKRASSTVERASTLAHSESASSGAPELYGLNLELFNKLGLGGVVQEKIQ